MWGNANSRDPESYMFLGIGGWSYIPILGYRGVRILGYLAKFKRTFFFSVVKKKKDFATNRVADGAPDAKLPRFCTEFRPESNGTSSGP